MSYNKKKNLKNIKLLRSFLFYYIKHFSYYCCMKDKKKYVYLHRRKTDNSIFYVGCGTKKRTEGIVSRSKRWKEVVEEHGFIVEIVFESEIIEEAFEYETELIIYYGLESNGGILCNRNVTYKKNCDHSDEVKRKISDANKGRILSDEHKLKLSKVHTGRKHTEETKTKMRSKKHTEESKQKIREASIGRKRSEKTKKKMMKPKSEETKQKIRNAQKGKVLSEEHKQKMMKPVLQYTKDDVFIREWNSMTEASQTLNIACGTISLVCAGKRKTTGGFTWKYKKDVD